MTEQEKLKAAIARVVIELEKDGNEFAEFNLGDIGDLVEAAKAHLDLMNAPGDADIHIALDYVMTKIGQIQDNLREAMNSNDEHMIDVFSKLMSRYTVIRQVLQQPKSPAWLPKVRALLCAATIITNGSYPGQTEKYSLADWKKEAKGILAEIDNAQVTL